MDTIETYGAVSDEVAKAMVEGLYQKTRTDFGVSITGIAGPDGGSDNKPVGTVCFGLKEPNGKISVHRYVFPGNREAIRENASNTALFLVYQSLKFRTV